MQKKKGVNAFIFFIILTVMARSAIGMIDVRKMYVSIHADRAPLREVLLELSNQSNTHFIFFDGLVEGKTVTCQIKNLPLNQALEIILGPVNLSSRVVPEKSVVLFPNAKVTYEVTPTSLLPITEAKPPTLRFQIQPEYPRLAQANGIEGKVGISFLVTQEGEVDSAMIEQSSGHKILDDAALLFAKRLRFNPAKQGKMSVSVWRSLELYYRLQQRNVTFNPSR